MRVVILLLGLQVIVTACGPGGVDRWDEPTNIVGDIYYEYSQNHHQRIIVQENGITIAMIPERVDDYQIIGNKLYVAQRLVDYGTSRKYAIGILTETCFYFQIDINSNEIIEIDLVDLPANIDCNFSDDSDE